MKRIFFAIACLFVLSLSAANKPAAVRWKSFSGDKHIEYRVDSLLKLMTLDEKIGQMTQFSCNWGITGPVMADDFMPYLKQGLVGSVFNASKVNGVRQLQKMAIESSRLHIPILFGLDVIHGYNTVFPIPLAEACSWDLDMMKKTAAIAAQEAASDGINWTFAPMVDIARDARWGRVMEGAGEDPYLGSLIAKARVEGFQGGNDWRSLHNLNTILACCKHFAAYGAAESGKDYNSAELSENTLRNFYLPPYEAAQKAGVATYMASFNEIGGVPSTASHFLMTDVLRKEWGFKGFVVTDYTGINELVAHGVAKDEKQAGELAVNAGIDMDMTGAVFIKYMKKSVAEGKVSVATIDNAVRHILEMKFILGLFDNPFRYLDEQRSKDNQMRTEFMETARQASTQSVVLLKNDKNVFPIEKDKPLTVALIGPFVKDRINLNGEWAGLGDRNKSIPLYDALLEKYKNTSVKFIYAEGCNITKTNQNKIAEAVDAASQADVVLAAMGEDFNWSGEAASRSNIQLPEAQIEVLKALKNAGKPIGLLVMSGRPLDLSWEDQNMNAIMEAWFLGVQSGNGLADVISGDYNPSGRLVMSFPRSVGQLPIYYNHKNTGRPLSPQHPEEDYKSKYIDSPNSPLYPFGFGLSYTTFTIDNVKLSKPSITMNDKLIVTADVQNTGKRDGESVVQLYVRDLVGSVTRPVKELKGFAKVTLKAGEKKQVSFTITADDLAFYGLDMKKKAEPGDFKLWVGQSSADESNEALFILK
ncbi:beta-glucosidase BglX [uncultured Bacteroides sp.]|uniref:beta-glucosidase BglX n=1 Tax=uncultured Bacteroides sp. TaxID=162156 RepID=UPI002AAB0FAD|nr:beta-glucosidase BglX [uncultured Bacteroides sp.]